MFKKITSLILIIFLFSLISFNTFAADSISTQSVSEENKTITVNFNVTKLKDYEDITILVYKKTIEKPEPDKTNIVYINQLHPNNSKLSFKLPANTADGIYEVRMGGTDIKTTSIATFEIKNIMFGDVNNDGDITISDAIWILRKLSGAEMSDYITIENGNINSDDALTISDVVWMLRYLSGSELPDYVKLPKE